MTGVMFRTVLGSPLIVTVLLRAITDRANPRLSGPQFIGVNIDSFRDKNGHVTRVGG